MMYQRHIVPLLAALVLTVAAPAASADQRNDPFDGASVGIALSFASPDGGSFRPRILIIHTASGAVAAKLPETSSDVRREGRLDLSETPLIGGLFRQRLAPSDARVGQNVGQVIRSGDNLHIEAMGWPGRLGDFPVAFSTRMRNTGLVSYRLGRLGYRSVSTPVPRGRVVGSAHILNGKLVIASDTYEPPSIGDLFRSTF